jgi:hypothetical protein
MVGALSQFRFPMPVLLTEIIEIGVRLLPMYLPSPPSPSLPYIGRDRIYEPRPVLAMPLRRK